MSLSVSVSLFLSLSACFYLSLDCLCLFQSVSWLSLSFWFVSVSVSVSLSITQARLCVLLYVCVCLCLPLALFIRSVCLCLPIVHSLSCLTVFLFSSPFFLFVSVSFYAASVCLSIAVSIFHTYQYTCCLSPLSRPAFRLSLACFDILSFLHLHLLSIFCRKAHDHHPPFLNTPFSLDTPTARLSRHTSSQFLLAALLAAVGALLQAGALRKFLTHTLHIHRSFSSPCLPLFPSISEFCEAFSLGASVRLEVLSLFIPLFLFFLSFSLSFFLAFSFFLCFLFPHFSFSLSLFFFFLFCHIIRFSYHWYSNSSATRQYDLHVSTYPRPRTGWRARFSCTSRG